MTKTVYFLVFLAFWAQYDDVLLSPVSVAQASPVGSDDDEYLPSEPGDEQARVSAHRPALAVNLESASANTPFARNTAALGWNLSTPYGRPLLYLFMSFQI